MLVYINVCVCVGIVLILKIYLGLKCNFNKCRRSCKVTKIKSMSVQTVDKCGMLFVSEDTGRNAFIILTTNGLRSGDQKD